MSAVTIVLGLTLVWINIERVDQAYELKSLEREYQEKLEQHSKSMAELHYLLAPATCATGLKKRGCGLRRGIRSAWSNKGAWRQGKQNPQGS